MGLSELFSKDLMFFLDANNKEDLFNKVASLLEERNIVKKSYRKALLDREKEYPTGLDMSAVGDNLPNVAIPHTDVKHNLKENIVFVKLDKPVMFHNMIAPKDTLEVSLLFFIINNSSDSQTNILAKLMDFFTKKGNLEGLIKLSTADEVSNYISKVI